MKPLRRHELRLTHPRLDLHVDVTFTKRYGRYIVVAALGEDRWRIGHGDTPQEAVRSALESFDEPVVSEMVESATQMAERLPSLEEQAQPYEEPTTTPTTSPPGRQRQRSCVTASWMAVART